MNKQITEYLPPKWTAEQTMEHQLDTLDDALGGPGSSGLLMLMYREFIAECELQGRERWLWRKLGLLGQ